MKKNILKYEFAYVKEFTNEQKDLSEKLSEYVNLEFQLIEKRKEIAKIMKELNLDEVSKAFDEKRQPLCVPNCFEDDPVNKCLYELEKGINDSWNYRSSSDIPVRLSIDFQHYDYDDYSSINLEKLENDDPELFYELSKKYPSCIVWDEEFDISGKSMIEVYDDKTERDGRYRFALYFNNGFSDHVYSENENIDEYDFNKDMSDRYSY